MSEKGIFATLAVFGFALTFALSFASERTEAWDHWTYFAIGVPAMALAVGVAGYLRPERSWSFGFAVVAASGIGSMFAAGLWFGIVIALACGCAALVGSKIRQSRRF